jgi:hypothetical protein
MLKIKIICFKKAAVNSVAFFIISNFVLRKPCLIPWLSLLTVFLLTLPHKRRLCGRITEFSLFGFVLDVRRDITRNDFIRNAAALVSEFSRADAGVCFEYL